MGPLVSREQQERVLGYIESGRKEGAKVMTGGDAAASPGFYVKPTVLANVRPDMKVVREEIFGPVLVAQRFEDLDDIAALANDTAVRTGGQRLVEGHRARSIGWCPRSEPGRSGSTATTSSIRPCRSAASNNRDSAASTAGPSSTCTPS